MKFQIHCNYWTKKSSYPVRASYFIELPQWNMAEAKDKIKSMNTSINNPIVKVEIFEHKVL